MAHALLLAARGRPMNPTKSRVYISFTGGKSLRPVQRTSERPLYTVVVAQEESGKDGVAVRGGKCSFNTRTARSVPVIAGFVPYECLYVLVLIRARCTMPYIACKATVMHSGAPLVELSWYLFSKYTNFVADVNLASSLLHKSRREIRKNGLGQIDRQNPEVTTNAQLWHIYSRTPTHKLITVHLRRTVTTYQSSM
jgi:hypothetical protein